VTQSEVTTLESEDSHVSADGCIRVRIGPTDLSYMGSIASGAKVMSIFADVETEIALRVFGNEGLCAGYESVEFLCPIRSGDFLEGVGRVIHVGRTSRKVELTLYRRITLTPEGRADLADPTTVVATARATIVSADRLAR